MADDNAPDRWTTCSYCVTRGQTHIPRPVTTVLVRSAGGRIPTYEPRCDECAKYCLKEFHFYREME